MSEFQRIAFRLNNGNLKETMMPVEKIQKIIDIMGSINCWIVNETTPPRDL